MKGIFIGLYTVLKHYPRKRITFEYPEVKRKLPARFRGRVYLNLNTCIGCTLCAQICPNHADVMVPFDYDNKKNKRKIYPAVNIGICTHCGLCQEICPTGSIRLTKDYETSRYVKDIFYTPDKLSKTEEELSQQNKTSGGGD